MGDRRKRRREDDYDDDRDGDRYDNRRDRDRADDVGFERRRWRGDDRAYRDDRRERRPYRDRDRRGDGRRKRQRSNEWDDPYDSHRGGPRSILDPPLKSFKQYVEATEEDVNPAEAASKYSAYKKKFFKRQCEGVFSDLHQHEWMKELYHPACVQKREEQAKEHAQESWRSFVEGKLDFDFSFREKAAGNSGGEGAGASSTTETSEGSASGVPESDSGGNAESGEGDEDGGRSDAQEGEQTVEGNSGEEDADEPDKESGEVVESDDEEKKAEQRGSSEKSGEHKDDALPTSSTVFVKAVQPMWSRSDVMEVLDSVEGCPVQCIQFSTPHRSTGFVRSAWALFETPEAALKVFQECNLRKMKGGDLLLSIPDHPICRETGTPLTPLCYTPGIASTAPRINADLELARKVAEHFDELRGIEDNPLFNESGSVLAQLSDERRLDAVLAYLRVVHRYCYYCGLEFESERDMQYRCGREHVRGKPDEEEGEQSAWVEEIEEAAKLRISAAEPPTVSSLTDGPVEDFRNNNIKQEGEERFRCNICNKLFKAEHFVQKHITNRHAPEMEVVMQEAVFVQYKSNFMRDPRRGGVTLEWWQAPPQRHPPRGRPPPDRRARPPPPGLFGPPAGMMPPMGFRGPGIMPMPMMMGRGGPLFHHPHPHPMPQYPHQHPGQPPRPMGGPHPPPGGGPGARDSDEVRAPPPEYKDLDARSEGAKTMDYRTMLVYDDL